MTSAPSMPGMRRSQITTSKLDALGNAQRLAAFVRRHDRVPARREVAHEQSHDHFLVIDDENVERTVGVLARGAERHASQRRSRRRSASRHVCTAATRRTSYPAPTRVSTSIVAAVLGDDAVDDGEAKPGAFPFFLRRPERIPNAWQLRRGDAGPVVADLERHHVVSHRRCESRPWACASRRPTTRPAATGAVIVSSA